MFRERGGVEIVMTLDIAAERVQLGLDLGRKIERGRKPIERKRQPERAIKNIVAHIVCRSKIRIGGRERLQNRHQPIIGRRPLLGFVRDRVSLQLNSDERAQGADIFAEPGLI